CCRDTRITSNGFRSTLTASSIAQRCARSGLPALVTNALEAAMKDLSVVVVNYNGISTVLETIESIYRLEGVRPSIVLIDDGSTDGSPAAVKERFPEVEVHAEPANTKNVNRLRNKGLRQAKTKYVLLTDNDVVFDSRFAVEMLSAFEADDRVAVCLPRLMDLEEKSRLF